MKNKLFAISISIVFLLTILASLPTTGIKIDNAIESNILSDNVSKRRSETEYWALIIGVGEYADHPGEEISCIREANDLNNALVSSENWKKDHIKLITGKDATVWNIIQGLKWLDRKEDRNDISLVYISTHGSPLLDKEKNPLDLPPKDEADEADEILMTYWGFAYPSAFIWDDQLNFYLSRLESKGVCLIVDSCYAGGFNDPPFWKRSGRNFRHFSLDDRKLASLDWMKGFAEDVSARGRVVLMGSREDEPGWDGGYSPFLIDALAGFADMNHDGWVTAEEAFSYTELRGWDQHPTLYDGYPGELPLVKVSDNFLNLDNFEEDPVKKHKIASYVGSNYNNLPENSTICGYITDSQTNNPIENAYINLEWHDGKNHHYNNTWSGSQGFYSMNVASGEVSLGSSVDGYFSKWDLDYNIDENETLWINISLYPKPPENSVVHGYVTDEETGDPIEDAYVDLNWEDDQGRYYWNSTYTDSSGYYSMNVSAGEIQLNFHVDGYFTESPSEWYKINENEVLWINASFTPHPPEGSVICGYVKDSQTNQPIENAFVNIKWRDEGKHYYNYTSSDSQGFYSINVAAGEIQINFYVDGYFTEYSLEWYKINENEVLWINASFTPYLPENSIVCGYITDSCTSEPIDNVHIFMPWRDGDRNGRWYYARTNSSGFYSENVMPGELHYEIYREGYHSKQIYRNDVAENETLWINTSLDPRNITVEITKPLKASYKQNQRIMPFLRTLIFGDIGIEVDAADYWYGVEKVEFYIDNVLKHTDTIEPYNWTWDTKTPIKHRHAIKVIAYDNEGNTASDEVTVWKFF